MDEQREYIIDCAVQLLKDAGYQAFSMDKLAEISSIDLGYLQSHFKTESLLLTTLATSVLESHCAYFKRCQIERSRDMQRTLEHWLRCLLQYRESEGCDTVFKELWVIGLHDREVRLVLDQYYRQLQHIIASQLQTIIPIGDSAKRVEAASCFLLPFVEGYGITRSTLPVSQLQLSEQLSRALLTILQGE